MTTPTRTQQKAMVAYQASYRTANNATTTFQPVYQGTQPAPCSLCGGAGWVFNGFGLDRECDACEGHGYDASIHQPPSPAHEGENPGEPA